MDLSSRLALQAGIDVRWHGDAQDHDGLAGTGLEPVTAGVAVRF